jgi:hypothetical protein
MSAPKKKPGATWAGATGRKLLIAKYYLFAFLARMFGAPFWLCEQKRTRLMDRIDNDRSDR